jgi:iron complex outermembrane receptor protein
MSLGYSWTETEIVDDQLRVGTCGSGQCTVEDIVDRNGFAVANGNPFPQSPDSMLFFSARYSVPMGNSDEIFFSTDWYRQGETNIFLYESAEYQTDGDFEGGVRAGYAWCDGQYEVAAFGRNITDEENLKGGIDFNNNAGFVNEGRFLGASFKAKFN